MNALVKFLHARIAEDKAEALAATPGPWLRWYDQEGLPGWDGFITIGDAAEEGQECNPTARVYTAADAAHIARHDPARVLAECDARLAIVDEHRRATFTDVSLGIEDAEVCWRCHVILDAPDDDADDDWTYPLVQEPWPCGTMRALAIPYADHEHYREEWNL